MACKISGKNYYIPSGIIDISGIKHTHKAFLEMFVAVVATLIRGLYNAISVDKLLLAL